MSHRRPCWSIKQSLNGLWWRGRRVFADSWPHCETTLPGCRVTIWQPNLFALRPVHGAVCVCVSGGRGETDRQADSQTEEGFVCWLAILVFTPLSYLPFSLQSLYVAMSLPLIDGLLVLPLVRKLAFVCLSVKELKEDALLTDVYEGTSSVCVCVHAHACVSLC